PAARAAWLPRLERPTYRSRLDHGEPGQPLEPADAPVAAHSIARALDGQYPLTLRTVAARRPHFPVLLRLRDGSQPYSGTGAGVTSMVSGLPSRRR
ncbi:two-component sensor histidine kinase, partial [Pseudomonas aeruginosa]